MVSNIILINTVPSFDLIGQKLTKICLFTSSIECRVTVSIMNSSTVQQQQQQHDVVVVVDFLVWIAGVGLQTLLISSLSNLLYLLHYGFILNWQDRDTLSPLLLLLLLWLSIRLLRAAWLLFFGDSIVIVGEWCCCYFFFFIHFYYCFPGWNVSL